MYKQGDKVKILYTGELAGYDGETEAIFLEYDKFDNAIIEMSDGGIQFISLKNIKKADDKQMENLCVTCENMCEDADNEIISKCSKYEPIDKEDNICPLCEQDEYLSYLEEENDALWEQLMETEEELLNAYRLIAALKAEKL